MSKRSFHWLHKYLLTLDAVLTRQGMEYMDYLIPDISAQQGIVLPLQPMSYATALKWLRYCINAPWKQQPSASLDPSVFTIHSCKATLLSWSAQKAHILTEEERLQQGHHRISAKGSLTLYSDDVHPAVRLQGLLREAILQGWRPSVPQHRGSQSALAEPQVDTIKQYSKLGAMDFHWFGFGAPQPLEGVSTPPPGYSNEGGHEVEAKIHTKDTCHIFSTLLWGHTFWRRSRYDSRWFCTRFEFILARAPLEISLWSPSLKDHSNDGCFAEQPDSSILQSPWLPTCLGVHV